MRMRTGLMLAILLALSTPAWAEDVQIGTTNIINQGSTRTVRGNALSPVTIRNWFFDLDLLANDWPHGPHLLDVAAVSSINVLGASTTPRSFYGIELAVTRTRDSYSLPHVGGANAIRGMYITLLDEHDYWESPHDADRWTGLGIYAHQGRRLGTGLVIGGAAGFDQPFVILGRDGREMFRVDGEGTVYLHGRALVLDADGTVRAR